MHVVGRPRRSSPRGLSIHRNEWESVRAFPSTAGPCRERGSEKRNADA